MNARARQWRPWTGIAAAALAALLAAGCGEEELYKVPESPFPMVGHLPLPSINEDAAFLGDVLYVAAGQAGIHAIDVSDPHNPILIDTADSPRYISSIAAIRTFAHRRIRDVAVVSDASEGITLYDITYPSRIVWSESFTSGLDMQDFCVEQPEDPDAPFRVFAADSWSGLQFFESDRDTSLRIVATIYRSQTAGRATDVAVMDSVAYVTEDQLGLSAIDARGIYLASGATELAHLGWADSPGNALAIAVSGDYAFVADKRQGMAVYNIADPERLAYVTSLPLDSWCLDIEILGDYAFLAADDAGLHIVDISEPEHPVYAGNFRTSNATGVGVRPDGLIAVTDEDDGVYILQSPFAMPDRIPPAKVFTLGGEALTFSMIRLGWAAPGDDGYLGTATSYEMRWAPDSIQTEADWSAATPIADTPIPFAPGLVDSVDVGDLEPGTTYFFAIRAVDDAGLRAPISNSPGITTLPPGIILYDAGVTPMIGLSTDAYAYDVYYANSALLAPTVYNVLIDGTANALTFIDGNYGEDAHFRLDGVSLEPGRHTFAWHFEDELGIVVITRAVDGPTVGLFITAIGTPLEELGRDEDEVVHDLMLSHNLEAQPFEVLQADWEAVGLALPESPFEPNDSLPVHNVSWYDAIDYCNLLSDTDELERAYSGTRPNIYWNLDANGWRLPTEAEWEYLCRAGTTTAFYNGPITEEADPDPVLNASGWYIGNSGNAPHLAGHKLPNADGLYDMHGNVAEWCWDWKADYPDTLELDPSGPISGDGAGRVIRGGSWTDFPMDCRSGEREQMPPGSRSDFVGFRVVRTIFD